MSDIIVNSSGNEFHAVACQCDRCIVAIMERDRQTKIEAAIRNGYSIAPAGTIHANDLAKEKQ